MTVSTRGKTSEQKKNGFHSENLFALAGMKDFIEKRHQWQESLKNGENKMVSTSQKILVS